MVLLPPDVRFDFYPRPPRGGRHANIHPSTLCRRFLSTPSARRATDLLSKTVLIRVISIHALREEGDVGTSSSTDHRNQFLSTPSARRATPF